MENDDGLGRFLEPQGYRRIALQKSAIGHFEVEATLNGHNVVMLIDTGAPQTVLDTTAARDMGLPDEGPCGDGKAVGAGGEVASSRTSIEDLTVETISMGMRSLPVVDLNHCNVALEKLGARRISGVIGGDVLFAKSAVIEFAKGALYLKE